MIKTGITFCAAVFLFLATALPQQAQEQGGSIRVQVHYTGKGTVNQSHKIYVALWDSPSFAEPNANAIPVAVKWVASENGIVTFSDVKKSPAYVSCAYDPAGKWEGNSAPPPDASLGMYSNAAMQPSPINVAPGKTETAQITFDDSVKIK